jgi:DNA-binding CsgD family transcriptional regulator
MRLPLAAFPFFFYVLWLLAVPMEGPLLITSGAAGGSHWFLMTHVATLVIIGRWATPTRLRLFARAGAAATALLTLSLPLAGDYSLLLMAVLGICAAPLTIKTCSDLHGTSHPTRMAAWCLIGANLLLAVIQATADLPLWSILLPFLPLLTMPIVSALGDENDDRQPLNRSYLLFVFIFQIVSGLMYAFLYPAYADLAFVHGLELPFYMAAVMAAVVIYRRYRDLLLVGGLTLAMAGFILLQVGGKLPINLSMFFMQAATGCIDLFLLALLLTSVRSVATFAYGLAVLCGGIAAGQFISMALGSTSTMVGMAGSFVLNIAALTLFLRHHRQERSDSPPARQSVPPPLLPATVHCLLSEREIHVLTIILSGKNYREAAQELAISESSIKTYMKRICDKLGASNRQELLRNFAKI